MSLKSEFKELKNEFDEVEIIIKSNFESEKDSEMRSEMEKYFEKFEKIKISEINFYNERSCRICEVKLYLKI